MKKMLSFASRRLLLNRSIATGVLSLLLGVSAHAASPQWFRDVARTQVPAYEPGTEAVILLDERIVTVSDSGEVKTTYRVAKKILNAHGRSHGNVFIHFDSETKVSNVHAWSIPPTGQEYELKEKDALEFAAFDGELYSDNRLKRIQLPSDPGSIVGYEYEQKERPRVFSESWSYQDEIPVITSRFTLVLPPSWEMETFWINRPKVEPVRNGNTYTWQEQNIAAIKEEDRMPAWRAVVPRMEVAFFPPSGKSVRAHTSWEDVGTWYYALANAQRQPTPATQALANQLIAGKTAFLDKVRAIAAFAQRDVRYVAIEIGIGGYQPHSATSILNNRYGDCKDKATLMSALLDTAGIKSYYVIAQTRRGIVVPDAPSMHSFNHMILAIQVPKAEKLPPSFSAVVENSTLGRLIIFDPTDDVTPLGLLPPGLEGNHGLLVQEHGSTLMPLPTPEPEVNGLSRTAKFSLSPDGALSGQVREVRTGSHARNKRHQLRSLAVADRRKAFENALAPYLSKFSLKDFSIENLDDFDKDLVVTYSFEAPDYSKKMGPLFLVRPRVFGTKDLDVDFNKKDRKYPFQLEAVSNEIDEFEIALPPGFTVDELPPPSDIKDQGLQYTSSTNFSGRTLTYKRTYRVGEVRFPSSKLADLKTFYTKVQQDEHSAAVLKRAQ